MTYGDHRKIRPRDDTEMQLTRLSITILMKSVNDIVFCYRKTDEKKA